MLFLKLERAYPMFGEKSVISKFDKINIVPITFKINIIDPFCLIKI